MTDLVLALELFSNSDMSEFEKLMVQHMQDVYAKWGNGYSEAHVNWSDHKLLQEMGIIYLVTARQGGVLVGYASVHVDHHPHLGVKFGRIDCMFVEPGVRGGLAGKKVMEYSLNLVKEKGGEFAYFGVPQPLAKALEQRGWEPVEVGMTYRLLEK